MRSETLSSTVLALLTARMLIEEHWGQGPSTGSQVCAVEALWCQFPGNTAESVACLHEALPVPWRDIISYNDHPTTTKADILALYDRAIDLALKDER